MLIHRKAVIQMFMVFIKKKARTDVGTTQGTGKRIEGIIDSKELNNPLPIKMTPPTLSFRISEELKFHRIS